MELYQEKEFGDRKFITEMYPPEYHISIENKLGQIAGGLATVVGIDGGDHINGDALASAISGLFASIDRLGGPAFYLALLKHTEVIEMGPDGQLRKSKVTLNHFRGRMAELKQVTIWVLRFNFEEYLRDAFGPLGGLLETAKARLGEKSQNMLGSLSNGSSKTSETTSIGESGKS